MKRFFIAETGRCGYFFEAESLEDAMLHADEKRVLHDGMLLIHDHDINLIAHRILDCPWHVEGETDDTNSGLGT